MSNTYTPLSGLKTGIYRRHFVWVFIEYTQPIEILMLNNWLPNALVTIMNYLKSNVEKRIPSYFTNITHKDWVEPILLTYLQEPQGNIKN